MPGFGSIVLKRSPWTCRLVVLLTASVASAGPAVRFVDDDAAPGGDGLTWNTAYRHLQDAIFEAATDLTLTEVRVAGGTYQPDVDESGNVTAGDRMATFSMRNNLALRGGYRGPAGGGDPDDRDFVAFETVLTGDLAGNDGPDFAGNDENSYHVVTTSNTDATVLLDGLAVTAGNANAPFPLLQWQGGGLLSEGGSPTLTQCIFRKNRAKDGAGLYSFQGSPTLNNCEFSDNQAIEVQSATTRGAGMFLGDGSVLLIECTFTGNVAEGQGVGGGLTCWFGTQAHLERCTFVDNHAGDLGGGFSAFVSSSVTLTQCLFEGNTASSIGGGAMIDAIDALLVDCSFRSCTSNFGGGLWAGAFPGTRTRLVGCEFDNNSASVEGGGAVVGGQGPRVVVGCRFTNNSAGNRGGGLFVNSAEPLTVTNSIFNANSVGGRGGGMGVASSTAIVANCTFAANLATNGKAVGSFMVDDFSVVNCTLRDGGDEVFINQGQSSLALTYSNVQGGWPGVGNIDADPLFVDPLGPDGLPGTPDDDFRLRAGSPCIDAGDNSQVPPDAADLDDDGDVVEPTPFDFDGRPRFVDELDAPDVGAGAPPLVDMGAFESQGDCNDNGIPDVEDIANLTSDDCNTNLIPDECEGDCNADGTPDACETIVAEQDCDRDGVCNGQQIADCLAGDSACADCNTNGIPDLCEVNAGSVTDCNTNGIPDDCDISSGTSFDCNTNTIPDDCETDCNTNGIADECDLASGFSLDCNTDAVPDECEPVDCNTNDVPDECDIANGTSDDCNTNGIPDVCDLDCNTNGVPDDCDLTVGFSADCNNNGTPDECDLADGTSSDCNTNETPDQCDIDDGTSLDCQPNGIPDECEPDCNTNGTPDQCDISDGASLDCQPNGVPDVCDIASGTAADCNTNGIPDSCETDCNLNGIPDDCDILDGTSLDCNTNQIPDECERDNTKTTVWLQAPDGSCGVTVAVSETAVIQLWLSVAGFHGLADGLVSLDALLSGYDEGAGKNLSFEVVEFNDIVIPFSPVQRVGRGTIVGDLPHGMIDDYEYQALDIPSCGASCFCGIRTGRVVLLDEIVIRGVAVPDTPLPTTNTAGFAVQVEDPPNPQGRGTACAFINCLFCAPAPHVIETGTGDFNTHPFTVTVVTNDCNSNGVPDHEELENGTSPDCNTNGIPDECETAILNLDIKPGSCPNSFNRNSHGVLPVALLGTDAFDLSEVDLSSVTISRADGVGGAVGSNEGPPGPHTVFEDVATPFDGEGCECQEVGGDGIVDLSMKFRTDDVVAALELDSELPGALVELVVSGLLTSGQPFEASDCVRLVPPGTPPGQVRVVSGAANRWLDLQPLDLVLDGGGFGAFERVYPIGSVIVLEAPASTVSGMVFDAWVVDGSRKTTGIRTLQMTVASDIHDLRSLYKRLETHDGRPPRQLGVGIGP